jgi:hypothetical protein
MGELVPRIRYMQIKREKTEFSLSFLWWFGKKTVTLLFKKGRKLCAQVSACECSYATA